jgi:hypothetical protein
MTGLEERLADFIARLRLEAKRMGQQQPTDCINDALIRAAMAKFHGQIADDLQGLLEPTLQRSNASPATIHNLRNGLHTLITSASILQQQLAKLEAAPGSVRGAVLPEKIVDILNTKTQALGSELASYWKDIDSGLAAFGMQEK